MDLTKKIYALWNECGRKHSTDSRKITPGCIFFALKGPSFDGNTFARDALSKGAAFAVIDNPDYAVTGNTLVVPDALKALQQLATYHRMQLKNTTFIALTGSNGKTTTKELIRSVLSQKFRVAATKGNLNNYIGVPLTLLEITESDEFAIIEMGANHQRETAELCQIAQPDFGMVTNLGKAHLEGFGGIEGVIKGEGEMYDFLRENHRPVFINADNPLLVNRCGSYDKLITYGTHPTYFCYGRFDWVEDFIRISWTAGNQEGTAVSNLTGDYNFENLLSAACIGAYFGLSSDQIGRGIENYKPDNLRSQILKKDQTVFILDYYNANPTSMEAALKALNRKMNRKTMAILGEMLELGDESEREHRSIAGMLKPLRVDEVILVGQQFKGMEALHPSAHWFPDSVTAARFLNGKKLNGYHVLIKGSRGTRMERIADVLLSSHS